MTAGPEDNARATLKRRKDAGPRGGPVNPSENEFLDGALRVLQPARGFRAGLDSVLLAAAVAVKANGRVFDLGMGAGVASLCLLKRRPDAHVEGVEIAPRLAAMAVVNALRNGFAGQMTIHTGDALRLPKEIPRQAFDAVMTNPPFLLTKQATAAPDPGKARAIALEAEDEAGWFKSALALLKPKGALTVIHRADALSRILSYLTPGAGAVEVVPLYPKAGEPAIRIVVRAVKGSRAPPRYWPGLVLHQSDGRFMPDIEAVLREGLALPTSQP